MDAWHRSTLEGAPSKLRLGGDSLPLAAPVNVKIRTQLGWVRSPGHPARVGTGLCGNSRPRLSGGLGVSGRYALEACWDPGLGGMTL
jgi:hypothetical protein